MGVLFAVNPRRKRRSKSRKHRSAAQRAATARLVALNRRTRRNPRRTTRKMRRRQRGFVMAPSAHRVRRIRRHARRAFGAIRARFGGGLMGNAAGLLKAGAIGGAGAVAVDVGMSWIKGYLPTSMQSPVNTDGSANFGYFGAKAALAIALGAYGSKLPVVGKYAGRAAEGALTVMSYQLLRPLVPSTMLGAYVNPAPTMRPGMNGVRGVRAYPALPVRSNANVPGRGARASAVVSAINGGRQISSEGFPRATPG